MPAVRSIRLTTSSPVVALTVSDVHLSLKPPLARAEEEDWLRTQRRVWGQVKELQRRHQDAPILCAGDVFDRWNAPAELINWALENLPHLYAVPGNHDLPSHRAELVHRSAYGTLVAAGKVTQLGPEPTFTSELALYGTPFGGPVPPVDRARNGPFCLHVLLTHEYLWVPGRTYEGAPRECRLAKVARKFRDFDVVVVGDNHLGFSRVLKNDTRVMNCGTLMRRKSSEAHYRPTVGMIHATGDTSLHRLDCSRDRLTELVPDEPEQNYDEVDEFVDQLGRLEVDSIDYRDNITKALRSKRVRRGVRDAVLEAMDSGEQDKRRAL